MTRTRAALLFRLAVVAAAPLLATASGHEAPATWDADTFPHLSQSSLAPVINPPRLLEIPRDVVPVALDFTPPSPEVDQRSSDDQTVERATERQPFPIEEQPQGLFHGEARGPASELRTPPIQRLPLVHRERAALPPRTKPFLAQPMVNTPVPSAATVARLPAVRSSERSVTSGENNSVSSSVAPSQQPSPMQAVTNRAAAMVRHGGLLADRGAYYSARAEFIQALRSITQALDAQSGTQEHSQALANGLHALSEADDFSPRGSQLEADMDLGSIIASHGTPVLKDANLSTVTPLAALQQYYGYAQQQLTFACGHDPAGSSALFGLGKLTTMMAARTPEERRLHGPKAVALHQAALQVDARNHLAASELGVLLATFGQYEDAKRVLQHAVEFAPQAENWHNLAVVHERLGEPDMAKRARIELQLAKTAQASGKTPKLGGPQVEWVDAATFAQQSPNLQTPVIATQPPTQRTATKSSGWSNPWLK